MYVRRIFSTLMIVVAMAAMLTGAHAQSNGAAAKPQSTQTDSTQTSLLGTWRVKATASDGFRFNLLMTFTPGRTSDEGALIETSGIDFTPPPCITQQGVWARTSGLNFDTTQEGFCFEDAPGNPGGIVKIRTNIKLGTLGNGFTGTFRVEVFDMAGNLLFASDATLRGTRMQVEMLSEGSAVSLTKPSEGLFKWKYQQ